MCHVSPSNINHSTIQGPLSRNCNNSKTISISPTPRYLFPNQSALSKLLWNCVVSSKTKNLIREEKQRHWGNHKIRGDCSI